MNTLTSLIAGVFKPAAELIDNMHTSTEEKLIQKARLLEVQAAVIDKGLEYEQEVFKARTAIIQAEAQSEHWVTATWRPITMLTFCALVVLDALGILESLSGHKLAGEAWTLLQLGIGGYTVGRTAEKITEGVLKSRVNT